MKHCKQLCTAFVLMLIFALPAFAGQMDTTRMPPPPSQATSAGEMDTGKAGEMDTTRTTPALEIALSFVQSVLSLI